MMTQAELDAIAARLENDYEREDYMIVAMKGDIAALLATVAELRAALRDVWGMTYGLTLNGHAAESAIGMQMAARIAEVLGDVGGDGTTANRTDSKG